MYAKSRWDQIYSLYKNSKKHKTGDHVVQETQKFWCTISRELDRVEPKKSTQFLTTFLGRECVKMIKIQGGRFWKYPKIGDSYKQLLLKTIRSPCHMASISFTLMWCVIDWSNEDLKEAWLIWKPHPWFDTSFWTKMML